MLGAILRGYSYIYHLSISVVLLALALIACASGNFNLKQEMLPWTGIELFYWMLGLGLAGTLSVILAFVGKIRVLFLIWAVAVVIGLTRGFLFGGMRFENADSFRNSLLFLAAGLIALLGAWSAFRKRA